MRGWSPSDSVNSSVRRRTVAVAAVAIRQVSFIAHLISGGGLGAVVQSQACKGLFRRSAFWRCIAVAQSQAGYIKGGEGFSAIGLLALYLLSCRCTLRRMTRCCSRRCLSWQGGHAAVASAVFVGEHILLKGGGVDSLSFWQPSGESSVYRLSRSFCLLTADVLVGGEG